MVTLLNQVLGWANWRATVGSNGTKIGYVILLTAIAFALIFGGDYVIQKFKRKKR